MNARRTVTRDQLEELGITDVKEDGTVYGIRKGVERVISPIVITAKHKYGKDMKYPAIEFYDSKTKKQFNIILSRLVFAWFHGLCPNYSDVDHIDNDPFNNSIDNLQLLTRKQNINKRPPCNQYMR